MAVSGSRMTSGSILHVLASIAERMFQITY